MYTQKPSQSTINTLKNEDSHLDKLARKLIAMFISLSV